MITRRDFLSAGGIVVVLVNDLEAQESGGRRGRRGFGRPMPKAVSAWLHIGEDGAITAYTGKVEVGQNSRTSLTQAVAEELRVKPPAIGMIMGDTYLTPFDMGTFGSMTTPQMWPQMRKAAAAAREMLVDLAAQKWKVDRASVRVADGRVRNGSRSAGFGELTHGQKLTCTITASEALTAATEWKVAGTSVPKVNARAMVTGAHKYAYDMKRPGMLYGKVAYPPSFGAKLVSLEASAAEKMPGVKVVHEEDFVGVAAADPETAERALAALKAQWNPLAAETNSRDVYEYFKKHAESGPPAGVQLTPYTVAYIAHTPLEPRAAVAEWSSDGKLTVWTGTQRPFGVRDELVQHFGLAEDHVHVFMPDTGSGYGGKHTGETAIEAARLAKAAGHPVKRNWTRQEEMTWAYFRPGALIEVGGTVNPDGSIASWDFHSYNPGGAGLASPYEIANRREQEHRTRTPLRQGSYRALAATAHNFVRESYMDELAHSIGMDPLEFRLKNAKNERLRAAIQAAADKFGWKTRRKMASQSGVNSSVTGFGISAGFEKGGYFGCCVEIAVTNGTVKVVRVVEAFECGAIVNPEHLHNQVEGAIIMGLGGALFEHIDFAENKIITNRLSRYRVPRFADVPKIESVLLDRKDIVSAGAGETPIMGIAPAVGNAIFDATGQRIRKLPMAPNGIGGAANASAAAVL